MGAERGLKRRQMREAVRNILKVHKTSMGALKRMMKEHRIVPTLKAKYDAVVGGHDG